MSDDEDDKSTIVLDLNALKEKLKDEETVGEVTTVDLEFNIASDEPTQTGISELPAIEVLCFEYGSDLFTQIQSVFPSNFNVQIIKDVSALNNALKAPTFKILMLDYDANAKAVNQISAQMKVKFPHCKVIITARQLNEQKAAAHAKTPSGAAGYLAHPLTKEKISAEVERIYKSS
jgi:hypothetical protein